ncbi:MAG: glycosyltransferase family 4 protein [Parcubacteria group bacterium]|nr:glycosyltransferase family 4 protein [Parcubacteria group bacterium]
MRVLMLSTDSKIFEKDSAVRARMIEYGRLCEELHIIIFRARIKNQESRIKISDNVFIYSTNSLSRWLYIFDAYKIAKRINHDSLFMTHDFLVTCQNPFETGFAGWRVSRALGARLELQVHTDFMSHYFAAENIKNKIRVMVAKFLLPKADCVRVVSERIKKSISGFTNAPIAVLPIFTDVQKFKNADGSRVRAEFPQFEKIVLVVSRLEPEKNVARAIEVFEKIIKTYPKAGLLVVGDGSERKNLKSQISNLKLEDSAIFVGSQKEIASYYAAADVYLHTSFYEGYGLSLVEAYRAGLPIVTTDVGIAGDVVSGDGVFICSVGNSICLADSLSAALSSGGRFTRASNEISKEEYLRVYKKQWESCAIYL